MGWFQLIILSVLIAAAGAEGQQHSAAADLAERQIVSPDEPREMGPSPIVEESPRSASSEAIARQSTELTRFLYNVAVGVAVAVLSTLILRAIL